MNNNNPNSLLEEKIGLLIDQNRQLGARVAQLQESLRLKNSENAQLKAVNVKLYEDNARLVRIRERAFLMVESLKHRLSDSEPQAQTENTQ